MVTNNHVSEQFINKVLILFQSNPDRLFTALDVRKTLHVTKTTVFLALEQLVLRGLLYRQRTPSAGNRYYYWYKIPLSDIKGVCEWRNIQNIFEWVKGLGEDGSGAWVMRDSDYQKYFG